VSAAAGSAFYIAHAAHERVRKLAFRLNRPRVERQGTLEQSDRLGVAGWPLRPCGASPENEIQRIGISRGTGGFSADQLETQGVPDPGCDLVP
jgi:hypothetical protein